MRIFVAFLLSHFSAGFLAPPTSSRDRICLRESVADISLEPKEVVKLFGRLAEKYIMLDDSGGRCCYSACSDCEFRLPDGGYIMADSSASRPKWIPSYIERNFEAMGKEHKSKWAIEIFGDDVAVGKETFIEKLTGMEFVPPLGGPYLSKSMGSLDDPGAAEALWGVLAGDKEKLTQHRMSKRLKELANGEEGITWKAFESSLN